ncbi:hypothetical protein GJ496_009548 [Pomphorhynchus laevis]|nr:hypothetical protein GJ496_009548 [Pomphorhynchus laevis]
MSPKRMLSTIFKRVKLSGKDRKSTEDNNHSTQAKNQVRTIMTKSLINSKIADRIEALIEEHPIFIFGKSFCPYCKKVEALFKSLGKKYGLLDLDLDPDGKAIQDELIIKTAQRTVPNVFIRNLHIGGCDRLTTLVKSGKLDSLLDSKPPVQFMVGDVKTEQLPDTSNEYDLIIIGGGSGGNACVKEAANLGAKVCVLDFVKPTPMGTTWGYGGTCVNVGCIPKKLMHQAALIGEYIKDAESFGYEIDHSKVNFDWAKLVSAISDHIHSLNFNYRLKLRAAKVTYMNAFAEFIDPFRLKCVDKKGAVSVIAGKKFVIACGGRPNYPGIPGDKEYCITSDDLFWLPYHPGKTLIVGASYIALECAGFLKELGCDVTLMVRSIFLRGFDQDMAERLGSYIERLGVKIIRTCVPEKVECITPGKPGELRVHFKYLETNEIKSDQFNTVIFAIGRQPCLKDLHLERSGVQVSPLSHKVITMNEKSSVDHIYALGDCAHENRQMLSKPLELTPVAIKSGLAIAKRLFGSQPSFKVDYSFIPTVVFTPLEYGTVGLSEDDARALYKDRIEIYHSEVLPFEWIIPHRDADSCYMKLIALKDEDETKTGPEHELIVGFHYLGPHAGELTQGFALALKKNSTKADFDNVIGIHPTTAESFTKLSITKSSGEQISASGC